MHDLKTYLDNSQNRIKFKKIYKLIDIILNIKKPIFKRKNNAKKRNQHYIIKKSI